MIDRETVERVARLARLELDADRAESLVRDLGHILDHVERLQELDLSRVEPLLHPPTALGDLRGDDPGPVLDVQEALRNAPDRGDDLFRVPRVIGDA